jgi:CheY-like chemotaxis protein
MDVTTEPPATPASAAGDCYVRRASVHVLAFLLIILGIPAIAGPGEPYGSYGDLLDKKFTSGATSTNQAVIDPDKMSAAAWKTYDLETAIKADVKRRSKVIEIVAPPRFSMSPNARAVAIGLALIVGIALVKGLQVLDRRFNIWAETDERWTCETVDPSLIAFFNELREGMKPSSMVLTAYSGLEGVQLESNGKGSDSASHALHKFFADAPGQVNSLRSMFSQIMRAPDESARQVGIGAFSNLAGELKALANIPEARPAWLVASALEGLFRQLERNTPASSRSALRTAAGAVDLLEALCVRGVNPNLATEPPVRLLAVDDDPVSRQAISFALRQVFSSPRLASDGQTALEMSAQQASDVIFLDVEMPNMDGFELCTKLRETATNRTTPVVFVTVHSDFDSRAKSIASGGVDLIAKPFLATEILLKTLTLALGARLQPSQGHSGVPANGKATSAPVPPATRILPNPSLSVAATEEKPRISALANETALVHPVTLNSVPRFFIPSSVERDTIKEFTGRKFTQLFEMSPKQFDCEFAMRAPARLENLQSRLKATHNAANPTDLHECLADLLLGVHSLSHDAEQAGLSMVFRLSSALESLLKKVLEHPSLFNYSIVDTAGAALEAIDKLCRPGTGVNLANVPVRILVVDDDPVARRAISGSVQLVFGRPDNADSGEAAVELAGRDSFDLIFLDVCMPGLDGFAACSKIRETATNGSTPIVFVTSKNSQNSRSQAIAVGGNGFIPKPVLSHQIIVAALTFILRARLKHLEPRGLSDHVGDLALAK